MLRSMHAAGGHPAHTDTVDEEVPAPPPPVLVELGRDLLDWVSELRLSSIPGTAGSDGPTAGEESTAVASAAVEGYFIGKGIRTLSELVQQLGESDTGTAIRRLLPELSPSDQMKMEYNYQKLLAKFRASRSGSGDSSSSSNNSLSALNKLKDWFGV